MKKALLFLALFCICGTAPQALDVTVFSKFPINKSNEAYLRDNIASIFTLKNQKWPSGEKLQVFILPKDSIYTKIFAQKYLKMSPDKYYDVLAANQAAHSDANPIIVESESELILKVLNTKGSIGYADSSVLINLSSRVYAISINNRKE